MNFPLQTVSACQVAPARLNWGFDQVCCFIEHVACSSGHRQNAAAASRLRQVLLMSLRSRSEVDLHLFCHSFRVQAGAVFNNSIPGCDVHVHKHWSGVISSQVHMCDTDIINPLHYIFH